MHRGATTSGPDATHPPTIFQNPGGGGGQLGGGSSRGLGGGSCRGSGVGGVVPARDRGGGGGVRVWVTELVEPVLVL